MRVRVTCSPTPPLCTMHTRLLGSIMLSPKLPLSLERETLKTFSTLKLPELEGWARGVRGLPTVSSASTVEASGPR